MRLEDAAILITGAGSGLGKVMAGAFVEEGARVACCDVDGDRLAETRAELEGGPGAVIDVVGDVRSPEAVIRLVETTREAFGRIDVLVNNVGIRQWHVTDGGETYPVAELPVEVWDAVIETNLRGTFLCSKAVLPEMLDRGSGRLIHLSSGQGVRGAAGKAPYVVTKFGIEGFHDSLALELEDTGVESLTLRPPRGGVRTETKEALGIPSVVDDPGLIAEPAVQLAAGTGENGGRYLSLDDGSGVTEYGRGEA